MFPGQKTFFRHGVVRSFRRRGNDDGVDTLIVEQSPVIHGGRGWLCLICNLLQPRFSNLCEMQIRHIGTGCTDFGTYAPTPTRPDDSDINPGHESSAWRLFLAYSTRAIC